MANLAPSYGGGLAQGSALNQPVSRMPQVQEQVVRGQNIMGRIEEKMKSLFDRLQPILTQQPTEQAGRGESPKPMLVGHANALSNHNDQLDSFDTALANILDRLEL
jgi:hypothetical protein